MNKMKRIFPLLLTILLLTSFFGVSASAALLDKSNSFYVADYANVLDAETEELICDYNGALEYQCDGAQIVVVTIDYLPDGMYSDEYADQLMAEWGVGDADANNGMLLLLAANEARGWLAVGRGLGNAISSNEVDDLLNTYFWDYVDADQHDAAVRSLFPQLLAFYDSYYGSTIVSNDSSGADNPPYYDGGSYFDDDFFHEDRPYQSGFGILGIIVTIFIILVVVFVLIAVFSALFGSGRRRMHYGYGTPYRRSTWFIPFFMPRRHYYRPPHYRPPHNPHNTHRPNGPPPGFGNGSNHGGGGGFGSFGGGRGGRGGGGFGGFGGFGGGGGFGSGSGFGGGGFGGGGGGGRR